MEPAFYRGDLLFLTNDRDEPIRAGEIVVFKVEGRDIPIVHRVLKLHERWVGRLSAGGVSLFRGERVGKCYREVIIIWAVLRQST